MWILSMLIRYCIEMFFFMFGEQCFLLILKVEFVKDFVISISWVLRSPNGTLISSLSISHSMDSMIFFSSLMENNCCMENWDI